MDSFNEKFVNCGPNNGEFGSGTLLPRAFRDAVYRSPDQTGRESGKPERNQGTDPGFQHHLSEKFTKFRPTEANIGSNKDPSPEIEQFTDGKAIIFPQRGQCRPKSGPRPCISPQY